MSKLKQLLFSLNETDRRVIEEKLKEKDQQIDQLKQQLEEKDKDLDLTTKTANELIEIKHKLEKQLEEKSKEIKRVTKIDNKTFLFETYEKPLREQIQQLKQQVVEKQNKIDEISKEFVQAVHAVYDWRVLCAEKDKEIEKLKVFEKAYYFNLSPVSKEYIKLMLQNAYQTPNQTQLAIQELEKVKTLIQNAINFEKPNFVEVYDAINKQIKELKGEKNDNY